MPRLRLGPENESVQNKADRSIFTSKFVFVLVTKSTQQKKPKHSEFFEIICFETSLPYRYLTYRPRFDAAWKALGVACILQNNLKILTPHLILCRQVRSCSSTENMEMFHMQQEYWHEYLDLVLPYKIINGYTNIDDSARPTMVGSGITRSQMNKDVIKFLITFANTVTFQSFYFVRACKIWNILSCDLRHKNVDFYTFKSRPKAYYTCARCNVYDYDDT